MQRTGTRHAACNARAFRQYNPSLGASLSAQSPILARSCGRAARRPPIFIRSRVCTTRPPLLISPPLRTQAGDTTALAIFPADLPADFAIDEAAVSTMAAGASIDMQAVPFPKWCAAEAERDEAAAAAASVVPEDTAVSAPAPVASARPAKRAGSHGAEMPGRSADGAAAPAMTVTTASTTSKRARTNKPPPPPPRERRAGLRSAQAS